MEPRAVIVAELSLQVLLALAGVVVSLVLVSRHAAALSALLGA